MLPYLAVGTPIRLGAQAAIGHAERGGVPDFRLPVEVQHVLVEPCLRKVMLERRVAVGDERHVQFK